MNKIDYYKINEVLNHKYYQIPNVFVTASHTETQGLTLLEAMAASVPVVAYDDEHLAKIVNRKAKPDYMDICQGILSEFKGLSKKTKSELENYIKNQSSKQVENAINTGILNFCDEANI